jgi:hypothetical protein
LLCDFSTTSNSFQSASQILAEGVTLCQGMTLVMPQIPQK